MNFFFDTSALIKKYIEEKHSDIFESYWQQASNVFVSSITFIECISTIRRLLHEKYITSEEYNFLKSQIKLDFEYFNVVQFNGDVNTTAEFLIDRYLIKTLDAIQLASCSIIKKEINAFIVFDHKLRETGVKEKIKILPKEI